VPLKIPDFNQPEQWFRVTNAIKQGKSADGATADQTPTTNSARELQARKTISMLPAKCGIGPDQVTTEFGLVQGIPITVS
jgi:hypothetical protein